MTVPPLQQVHLIQISLDNFKPDKGNTGELDRISYCLSYLLQSHGHIPDVAKQISVISECVTTLYNPNISIGLAEYPPDVNQAYEDARDATQELLSLIQKAESNEG